MTGKFGWLWRCVAFYSLLIACAGPERALVLESVDGVMSAINDADPLLLNEWMVDDAVICSVMTDGRMSVSSVADMADSIASNAGSNLFERTWAPIVKVSGAVANVWINYEFTIDGVFSHAGVNSIQLVRINGKWLVNNITYSILPKG
ncbi:MAG TPA: hypothetical protein EYO31_01175 [Phycisphaerales bacterium]|jgi:hypothetical protein|nr:hypothetical protein [Phycisphaerales bacterium]